jgi:hypothetical protein
VTGGLELVNLSGKHFSITHGFVGRDVDVIATFFFQIFHLVHAKLPPIWHGAAL